MSIQMMNKTFGNMHKAEMQIRIPHAHCTEFYDDDVYFTLQPWQEQSRSMWEPYEVLYAAIHNDEVLMKKLTDTLDEWDVYYEIDHSYDCDEALTEAIPAMRAILSDKDMLMRFLFGDTQIDVNEHGESDFIITAHIPEFRAYNFKTHTDDVKPNDLYHPERYTYFYFVYTSYVPKHER